MGAPLPLTFSAAPLPPGNKTPQDWADALVARLVARSTISIAFFVTGTTAPTSDMGPWLNTGTNPGWYFWDIGTSTYVPMPIPQASLRWYIGQVTGSVPPDPDPAVYDFWIVLNGSGVAIDLQTYSGGAWTSILAGYSTTAQMNAAIAAATPITYPFKGSKQAIGQSFTAGASIAQVVFDKEEFDPSNVFGSNVFTTPVAGYYHFTFSLSVGCSSGAPTSISLTPVIRCNGAVLEGYDNESDSDTSGRTYVLTCDLLLSAGDVVDCAFSCSDAGNVAVWEISNDTARSYFSGSLIQKI